MSNYQITVYEQARSIERKEAANNAKKMKSGLYEDSTSSYRNLSRTSCNFVFPENIIKPVTVKKKTDKGEKTDESSAKETKEPNEIIYLRYDNENMKYIYLCTSCNYSWKNN